MIKKMLISTLGLLVLYNIFIVYVKPNLIVSQHQWQDNSIKAQEFILSDSSFQNVIVGSSLANRLPQDSLEAFFNLSFSGKSVFDGLKILVQKDKLPKKVFIETNVLLRDEDPDFTSSFSNSFLFYSRKYIVSLRDGRQPLAIASQRLSFTLEKLLSPIEKILMSPQTSKSNEKLQQTIFEKLLENQKEHESTMPSAEKLDSSFSLLKYYVGKLRQKNVEVIFFEMPVNIRICNLAAPVVLRKYMAKLFPEQEYKYIPQPDCSEYKTMDGVHLSNEEAAMYVSYFKTFIKLKGY